MSIFRDLACRVEQPRVAAVTLEPTEVVGASLRSQPIYLIARGRAESLQTLADHRRDTLAPTAVNFGLNLILDVPAGRHTVGDQVIVR